MPSRTASWAIASAVSRARRRSELMIAIGSRSARAAAAARACGLALLAQANAALGSLDRVARVVKLTGFVASTPDFTDQPEVINGCSDLMVEVFGDAGKHARSAVGVYKLPLGFAVEVDAIVEIR